MQLRRAVFLVAIPGYLVMIENPGAAQCLPVNLGSAIAGDPDAFDGFGESVDVDGQLAVVGAPGDDQQGIDAGAAYIIEWTGSGWVQRAKLVGADTQAGDEFGRSVAISGNRVAVGAPRHDVGATDCGAVYEFEYFPGQGWLQAVKLSKGIAAQRFGSSVALDADLLGVGCGATAPVAHVYRYVGGIWNHELEDSAYGPNVGASYPVAVAVDGNSFVMGVAGWDIVFGPVDNGCVHLFEYNGGSWHPAWTWVGSSGQQYYGYSLSIDEDHLVIGRYVNAAVVYKRGASGWPSTGQFLAAPSYSVSISADRIAIGTLSVELPLFQESASTWKLVSNNSDSGAQPNDQLGKSVSVSPGILIAGAPATDQAASNAGAAFSFGFTNFQTYCTPKVTTIPNCLARMTGVGTPSASSPQSFEINAGPVPGSHVGCFFWSSNGPAAVPFQLGYLCVQSPVIRSNGITCGGTAGVCNGTYKMLLSDLASKDPSFSAGLNYYVQCWFRDPGNAFGSSLSNGLRFVVCN